MIKKYIAFSLAVAVFGSVALLAPHMVFAAPTLANPNLPEATVGQAYSYQLQGANGTAPYTFQKISTNYPGSEITLSSAGLLSGTPQSAGTWDIQIRISDNTSPTSTYGILSFKVNPSSSSGNFVTVSNVQPSSGSLAVGQTANITWTVSNLTTPVSTTISLQTADGAVRYEKLRISSNTMSANGANTFAWVVPSTVVGANYKVLIQLNQIFTDSSGGGTFPKAESSGLITVTSGGAAQPPGLSVSLQQGSAAGSVPAGAPNYALADFNFTASNGTINISSIQIVSDSVNAATNVSNISVYKNNSDGLGVASSLSTVSGSVRSATITLATPLSIASGQTVSVNITGSIANNATGSIRLGIGAITFSTTNNALLTAQPVYGNTITISGTNSGTLSITSPNTLPNATVGQTYSYQVTTTGGTAPYVWNLLSSGTGATSTYPCCYLTLTQDGKIQSVSGQQGQVLPFSGTYQISVSVTDSAGRNAIKTFTLTVNPTANPTDVFEGYVDFVSPTQIYGWAFSSKANTARQAGVVNVTFERVGSPQESYTLSLVPTGNRQDVTDHLKRKFGLASVDIATAFSDNPSRVLPTSGTFKIKDRGALYDGNELTLSDQAKRSFTIGSIQNPPGPTSVYVKVEDDPTVYWVSSWGGKMPVLSEKIFLSYGAKWTDIRIITQEQLDGYDEVLYIKLRGNARVYKLENLIKRYLTPAAATRLNIDPARVVEVNSTEFYTYRTGTTIY